MPASSEPATIASGTRTMPSPAPRSMDLSLPSSPMPKPTKASSRHSPTTSQLPDTA